ncbi:CRP/FNR family transcriptional regulator [Sphingomonas sp. SORGH_AS870]|uniref:Crp/Fnr family transcriptional regulator n=1 Tax=Sphingomonas sp. SORGH_AS_0870 TaxID=3041801 RepID=UPI00285983B2|nr:Crp/Fnr family transcriptional regulator [Sphingomonas sp. SORGH_AS_0870]MDR6145807.1 CRP/FNR family transcriptional regulator [Sphingomonas sp. SORGH_AS_0870]
MLSDLPPRCAACAGRSMALCDGLDEAALAAIHHIGHRRWLRAGQAFGWIGDPARHCAHLVSGVLKVTRMQADGGIQIVGLLYPGDFVGTLFADRSADAITALGDADLCVYPRQALEEMLVRHPAAGRLLLRRTLATLGEVRRWMPMLARARADARVAALLLDMARRCGAEGDGMFRLPLSRGAMAEALGLAVETVSRHMTALQNDGVIQLCGLRGVRLIDRTRLAIVAG